MVMSKLQKPPGYITVLLNSILLTSSSSYWTNAQILFNIFGANPYDRIKITSLIIRFICKVKESIVSQTHTNFKAIFGIVTTMTWFEQNVRFSKKISFLCVMNCQLKSEESLWHQIIVFVVDIQLVVNSGWWRQGKLMCCIWTWKNGQSPWYRNVIEAYWLGCNVLVVALVVFWNNFWKLVNLVLFHDTENFIKQLEKKMAKIS